MAPSLRLLCALGIAVAASSSSVKAAKCTTSQTDELTSALTEYESSISTCTNNPCTVDCVRIFSELADSLPDCEYIDGVNYADTVQLAVDACALIAGDAGSAASASSSSLASDSSECSASDLSTTGTYIDEYNGTVSSNCGSDECSADCVATVTELVAVLPNCVYSDGNNYYETISAITSSCSGSSSRSSSTTDSATGSEDSPTTSSSDQCSLAEDATTESVLADISARYTAACTDDACSSECADVLDSLANDLPDCTYSDGTNYRDSVLYIIAACKSTTREGSPTASSRSEQTLPFLRTLIPTKAPTDEGDNGAPAGGMGSISTVAVAAAVVVAQLV